MIITGRELEDLKCLCLRCTQESLISKKEIQDLVQQEIDTQNRELAKVENIRKFTILKDEFSQEKEEVTPTFKIKRRIINERYADLVEKMYE